MSRIDQMIKKMTSKKGRWVTLLVWIIFAAVLSMVLPNVNKTENNAAKSFSNDVMSVKADAIAKKEFPTGAGLPLLIVWKKESGLQKTDYEQIINFYKKLDAQPVDQMGKLPPFASLPWQAFKSSASKDGKAIVTPVFIKSNASQEVLQKDVNQVHSLIDQTIKTSSKNKLVYQLTGPVGIQVDAVKLFSKADFTLLFSTVLLVLLLLIVIYRSPILALVPLIGVGFAYGVISPLLGGLAKSGLITIDSQAASIMTVLLFGAGTDYCLFLVAKYREKLTEEQDKTKAIQLALKQSGGAIFMSAVTVVIGLLILLLGHYKPYHRFGVPFSLAVLIMGIAALTLLPALLSIIGRASFWPFIPRTEKMIENRSVEKGKKIKTRPKHGKFSRGLGLFVTQKPWLVIILSVVVLGGLGSFATKMTYSYDLLNSFPKDMPSRVGYDWIAQHFSPGELAPIQVIVNSEGKHLDLQSRLAKLKSVSTVSTPQKGKIHSHYLSYQVTLKQNPYTPNSINLIPKIQSAVVASLKNVKITPSNHYWIGGQTSELYDTKTITSRDSKVIVTTMLIVIALLLVTYLRSVVAMVYLLLTVLLSYFASLGTGWLVLHYLMGASTIQGLIPLYAFVFLVALGEDYNIFMISSIWRNRHQMGLKEAVAKGVTDTSHVITSAGLILAGTFAVLATLPIQILVQFGIVTAIGVLLDTFIVRPLLVPAITTVLGRFAFWPGKLWRKS